MKIALPIEKKSKDSKVNQSFGRSTYFLIYDVKSKNIKFIENNKATESISGAGIKTAQLLIDENIDTIICYRCGENALEVIKSGNIKIYKAINLSAIDNIKALINGELELL